MSTRLSLTDVAEAYLADSEFQQSRADLVAKRDASIPGLQQVTHRFVQGEYDIQLFRAQLEKVLRIGEDWGATGYGFMMELNKFGKYHNEKTNAPEVELRNILNGLYVANMGQRIERFYNFLLDERDRLRRDGKSSGMIVAPRNSAFIISLFTYWLDPQGEPLVYYDSMRKGLYLLIKANVLPVPPTLQLAANAVEVRTASDHKSCVDLVQHIATHAPQVKLSTYWAEYFCLWVTQNFASLSEPSSTLVKEPDQAELLSKPPASAKQSTAREPSATYLFPPTFTSEAKGGAGNQQVPQIKHEPLRPTPEPLLSQLIRQVQRHILVDEAVVRRIYHALLAGHVILTGPPGTGKTELAHIIPEILWRSEDKLEARTQAASDQEENELPPLTTRTAYTTRLVTATDEWSVRTLISGIAPQSKNGTVSYSMQYGYLTTTILKNWSFDPARPEEWNTTLLRTTVTTASSIERGVQQTFRGQWLVIDEFNRAPIDLALGDALTALGGSAFLRVAIDGGSAELPIPLDFRIIGTLNSFDRSYLNQISEALKRRFSFIEILPPTRAQRAAEQGIVLYKALKKISHLSDTINAENDPLYWEGGISVGPDATGLHEILWEDDPNAFHTAFEAAWRLFEVIRIYRQLGTAQAISFVKHMLIAGVMQGYTTGEQWIEQALDTALCDTIIDQLQVLLPDEVEALLIYLTNEPAAFPDAYHALLTHLTSTPQRLYGHLLALGSVCDQTRRPLLSDAEIELSAASDRPSIPPERLHELFHLANPAPRLPQFTRRLRAFKAERGL